MYRLIYLVLVILFCCVFQVNGDNSAYSINKHIINPGEELGSTSWSDTLMTNGGTLAINKNVDFDSQNQTLNRYNLNSAKILTYTGMTGSHLLGEESYLLGTTGSTKPESADIIRCFFTSDKTQWLPAFCNTVQAKASLVNINNAQISQSGMLRMTGNEFTPAELKYHIAVSPDSRLDSSSAEGTIETEFTGTIMEGRGNETLVSGSSKWNDASEISGSIKKFQKSYAYLSGIRV